MRGSTIALLGLMAAATAGVSAHGAYLETFDSAATGSINNIPGWYGGATPPSVNTGGVAGSQGVGRATEGFNWTGHSFRWDTMNLGDKVIIGMDYQSDGTLGFNDDRMGWTTNASSVSSGTHFGVQLDEAGGTQGVKTYWKNSGGSTQQWEILNFANAGMTITNNGWYRARATFTKIGDAAAQIDVTVQALDPAGNPVGSIYTGSMGDSSHPTGVSAAPATLFAGDLTPMFKNFNASSSGNVDNAYFSGVIAVPEPAALTVLALGSLVLGRRRHA